MEGRREEGRRGKREGMGGKRISKGGGWVSGEKSEYIIRVEGWREQTGTYIHVYSTHYIAKLSQSTLNIILVPTTIYTCTMYSIYTHVHAYMYYVEGRRLLGWTRRELTWLHCTKQGSCLHGTLCIYLTSLAKKRQ